MNITEFLEARIAEDEAEAQPMAAMEDDDRGGWAIAYAERVLAECAAKRAIIGEHGKDESTSGDYCETCAEWWKYEQGEGAPPVAYPCPTVRALAAVYADHPDYQQEWPA